MDREKVIKGLEHCIGDDCNGDKWRECKYSGHGCIDALLEDALALLKEQDKDAEIIRKCRDGKVLKHVGNGVVVLNFEWWRKMVSKCDHIKIVPSVEELLKAQEPVKPIENAGFYYCGACKYAFTSARQKYCSDCGRKVKWE